MKNELTISLASVLDTELQLGQLAKILKIFRLSDLAWVLRVLDGLKKITKNSVRQLAVAITAEVASGLMNILWCPESAIGNIDVDGQASAWLTNRRNRLDGVSNNFE
jgi:hypothetical protein